MISGGYKRHKTLAGEGMARLEEAVTAYHACLIVTVDIWPPERLTQARTQKNEAQAAIRRRSAKLS